MLNPKSSVGCDPLREKTQLLIPKSSIGCDPLQVKACCRQKGMGIVGISKNLSISHFGDIPYDWLPILPPTLYHTSDS